MVRHMPIIHVSEKFTPIPLAIGLFVSITLVVSLCAKHARQKTRKHTSKTSDHPNTAPLPLPLPLPSPKKIITTLSHKALMVKTKKSPELDNNKGGINNEENGVWQKAILMGERCQPPEFSGVIYYDYSGNRISEMPKSPRATSMSPLRNFTFPIRENDNYVH